MWTGVFCDMSKALSLILEDLIQSAPIFSFNHLFTLAMSEIHLCF